MAKVSVIVPAYNSHDTLATCLGSLVHQTLQDIEIIVINDASTDDTWEIMKRCKGQFSDKVRIIDGKVNRGSGGARNQGFDAATGEYIGLVDSDDYVAPNMYELLYNQAKEGDYDIVDSGYYKESTDKAILSTGDNVTGTLDDEKRNILIAGGGYLVTKIFRRELFNCPPIRMRENVRCLEDTEILIYMILRAKKIGNVKEILYKYCDIKGSATKQIDLKVYLDSVVGAMKAIYERCAHLSEYEGAKESIDYMAAVLYSYGINRCLFENIRKYGAKKEYIDKYFLGLNDTQKEYLKSLYGIKEQCFSFLYDKNYIIQQKLAAIDIAIMKKCDQIHKG
ncbi:glycosyltransferase [Butyrivibrio sp. DSM 10294]|uniref:glycosyltransferase family 2 protein n=1 Tax=Butyrivibrio sp. DSM 10294 TaxID=2972457 RepID=UPI00234EC5BB|nr:glycosyltransferase family 2 protein [Butyrivibrio sp. DSM 10294]MDC7293593.1 glycosyltransferase [Butyrivibrio sp. DSM 10294]